jgi:hypothetical protein
MSNTEPSETKNETPPSSTTMHITSQSGNSNVNTMSDALVSQFLDRLTRMEERYEKVLQENATLKAAAAQQQRRESLHRRLSTGVADFNELIDSEPTSMTDPLLSPPTGHRVRPPQTPGLIRSEPVKATSSPESTATGQYTEEQWRTIRKAMSKLIPPPKFSGKTEAEKEGVENWVRKMNNYLDGLFGDIPAPRERMTQVLQLLEEPAVEWMNSMYNEERGDTWEQLQLLFIQHIRGSRDTRALTNQKMKALKYGEGECKDLLAYDSAFERLRIKLYPSSNTNVEMNERTGEDYCEGIKRGNLELWKEMKRCLAARRIPGQLPSLADCKAAAADAVEILAETRVAVRSTHSAFPARQQPYTRQAVHNITSVQQQVEQYDINHHDGETVERREGQTEQSVSAQKVMAKTRSSSGSGDTTSSRSFSLTEEEREQLMRVGKCFRCYGKGHLSQDPSCPGRGKPRRKPTAEQLKA